MCLRMGLQFLLIWELEGRVRSEVGYLVAAVVLGNTHHNSDFQSTELRYPVYRRI